MECLLYTAAGGALNKLSPTGHELSIFGAELQMYFAEGMYFSKANGPRRL
jgi:hypothetical protein